ncbi:MAG: glycosyltransferase [bacterium]|nr:glycosyltransferase [bacterium]
MKIALVHDYLREYGGAERVLEALHEIWPEASVYTAFVDWKGLGINKERFKNWKIKTSWIQKIPFYYKLYSPLRFLAPFIWESFKFNDYDLIVGSAGWYITKGFCKDKETKEICYCHTPPRWLYGYKTSVEWQKFWPIKVYGTIIGHFMRLYDFKAAQRVDYFIANSEEVRSRIKKFYRREATVIYPPVDLPEIKRVKKQDYYFIVTRLVGGKGLDLAVETAQILGFKLKIAGVPAGYNTEHAKLSRRAPANVEFLGCVSDEELTKLYSGAKAFLALAGDEDFGITPVEAMLCGTPVIAFAGGGYKETVIDGETGVFFHELTVESLSEAIKRLDNLTIKAEDCIKQARKFSKERFKKEIREFVERKWQKSHSL